MQPSIVFRGQRLAAPVFHARVVRSAQALQVAGLRDGDMQLQAGAVVSEGDLRDYLQPRLARYKLPRRIRFVEDKPCEVTGQIFRRRLREPLWEGRPRRI